MNEKSNFTSVISYQFKAIRFNQFKGICKTFLGIQILINYIQ